MLDIKIRELGRQWTETRDQDVLAHYVACIRQAGEEVPFSLLVQESSLYTPLCVNAQGMEEFRHKTTGMIFVLVPAGEFMMGSEDAEKRQRVFDEPFLMAKYPWTGREWHRVTGDYPSHFPTREMVVEQYPEENHAREITPEFRMQLEDSDGKLWGDHPVESVSWDRCREVEDWINRIDFARKFDATFCPSTAPKPLPKWLAWSEIEHGNEAREVEPFPKRGDGEIDVADFGALTFPDEVERLYQAWLWNEKGERCGFQLPTESMWEYAARAGTTTRYPSGDTEADLEKIAWFGGEWANGHKAVGLKEPNNWGLHDNCGNVFEWSRCMWQRDVSNAPENGFIAHGEVCPDLPYLTNEEISSSVDSWRQNGTTEKESNSQEEVQALQPGASPLHSEGENETTATSESMRGLRSASEEDGPGQQLGSGEGECQSTGCQMASNGDRPSLSRAETRQSGDQVLPTQIPKGVDSIREGSGDQRESLRQGERVRESCGPASSASSTRSEGDSPTEQLLEVWEEPRTSVGQQESDRGGSLQGVRSGASPDNPMAVQAVSRGEETRPESGNGRVDDEGMWQRDTSDSSENGFIAHGEGCPDPTSNPFLSDTEILSIVSAASSSSEGGPASAVETRGSAPLGEPGIFNPNYFSISPEMAARIRAGSIMTVNPAFVGVVTSENLGPDPTTASAPTLVPRSVSATGTDATLAGPSTETGSPTDSGPSAGTSDDPQREHPVGETNSDALRPSPTSDSDQQQGRYADYAEMDLYPEIGMALGPYSDDAQAVGSDPTQTPASTPSVEGTGASQTPESATTATSTSASTSAVEQPGGADSSDPTSRPCASSGAAAGSSLRPSASRPTASGTRRATGSSTWASALPGGADSSDPTSTTGSHRPDITPQEEVTTTKAASVSEVPSTREPQDTGLSVTDHHGGDGSSDPTLLREAPVGTSDGSGTTNLTGVGTLAEAAQEDSSGPEWEAQGLPGEVGSSDPTPPTPSGAVPPTVQTSPTSSGTCTGHSEFPNTSSQGPDKDFQRTLSGGATGSQTESPSSPATTGTSDPSVTTPTQSGQPGGDVEPGFPSGLGGRSTQTRSSHETAAASSTSTSPLRETTQESSSVTRESPPSTPATSTPLTSPCTTRPSSMQHINVSPKGTAGTPGPEQRTSSPSESAPQAGEISTTTNADSDQPGERGDRPLASGSAPVASLEASAAPLETRSPRVEATPSSSPATPQPRSESQRSSTPAIDVLSGARVGIDPASTHPTHDIAQEEHGPTAPQPEQSGERGDSDFTTASPAYRTRSTRPPSKTEPTGLSPALSSPGELAGPTTRPSSVEGSGTETPTSVTETPGTPGCSPLSSPIVSLGSGSPGERGDSDFPHASLSDSPPSFGGSPQTISTGPQTSPTLSAPPSVSQRDALVATLGSQASESTSTVEAPGAQLLRDPAEMTRALGIPRTLMTPSEELGARGDSDFPPGTRSESSADGTRLPSSGSTSSPSSSTAPTSDTPGPTRDVSERDVDGTAQPSSATPGVEPDVGVRRALTELGRPGGAAPNTGFPRLTDKWAPLLEGIEDNRHIVAALLENEITWLNQPPEDREPFTVGKFPLFNVPLIRSPYSAIHIGNMLAEINPPRPSLAGGVWFGGGGAWLGEDARRLSDTSRRDNAYGLRVAWRSRP